MALKNTIKGIYDLLASIATDLTKADGGNRAAAQRVRTGTIKLEKIAKIYRKESIADEKKGSPSKKKVAAKAKPAKAKAKPKKKSGGRKATASFSR